MVQTLSKTVTLAVTPEAIITTNSSGDTSGRGGGGFRVSWVTIQAKSTNAGVVKIRAPLVSSPVGYELLNPGDSVVLWSTAVTDSAIDLTKVFLEVTVNGEGANVSFVK